MVRIREQLSIRRLLLAVVVAAFFVKHAEWSGLIAGFRLLLGIVEEGNQGWFAVAATIGFAAVIWLGYTFWFGIVLPGAVERYLASRKLRTKRREAMLKSLEEFEHVREGD